MTHSPSEAQGRWKLRLHPLYRQVMVAPVSPQMKQRWKEHSSPLSGRLRAAWLAPGLWAGRRLWALLACTLQICLAHEAFACAGASVELLGAGVCPRAGGRAGISFLGSRRSSRKPLLVQNSLLLPGPYLLGCLLDCTSGVLNEKPIPALLWKKPAGKKLQSREGQELVRSARKG